MRVVLGVPSGALLDGLVRELDAEDEWSAVPDAMSWRLAVGRGRPDGVIIDNDLGGSDRGAHAARMLRDESDAVVVLLNVANPDARIAALLSGIDECVAPGTDPAEIIARLRVHHRRRTPHRSSVRVGDLVLDEEARLVVRGEAIVDLTRTEFEILRSLVRRRGRVVPVPTLIAEVWTERSVDASVVQVHISSLRRKLGSSGPRLIETVRGVGYVLRTPTAQIVLRDEPAISPAS